MISCAITGMSPIAVAAYARHKLIRGILINGIKNTGLNTIGIPNNRISFTLKREGIKPNFAILLLLLFLLTSRIAATRASVDPAPPRSHTLFKQSLSAAFPPPQIVYFYGEIL